MAPRPFPYPLGVGIDVCKVPRVASFLRNHSLRNRWARKIFTRLEWPALWNQFYKTQRASMREDGSAVMDKDQVGKNPSQVRDNTWMNDSVWMLPNVTENLFKSEKRVSASQAAYREVLDHDRTPIGLLARHLAGRWAAKEAVIKAHSHRQLYMRDISIVNPRLNPNMFPLDFAKTNKVVALIDPPTNTILIDEKIAEIRALRGFGPRSRGLQKGALLTRREHDFEFSSKTNGRNVITQNKMDSQREQGGIRYYERRAKIEESERQIAEVNISHDGNTAVAVCIALDQPGPETKSEQIIDNGEFLPVHEPQWGDEGWFSKDKMFEDMFGHESTTGLEEYKEAMDSFLKHSEKKIPFLP